MFNFTLLSIKIETNNEVVVKSICVTYLPQSLYTLTEAGFHGISELVPYFSSSKV